MSIRRSAMVGMLVLATGGFVADPSRIGVAPPRAGGFAQRVVFVSYVDEADDVRGLRDFQALDEAMHHADGRLASEVKLDFVQVSLAKGESIDTAMLQIAASGPAAIVATCDDVLDAARRHAGSIPIVFASHADPVAAGYVKSIAAPGLPRTGFTYHLALTQKMIEVLADAHPDAHRIGIVADAMRVATPGFAADIDAAMRALDVDVTVYAAASAQDVETALHSSSAAAIDAWYVPVGEALWNDEARVLDLMERSGRPVLYERTRLARRPGSMAYEPRVRDPFGILAHQLVLVLRGVDPRTIPVERPSEFELAVNLTDIDARAPAKSFVKRADKLFLSDLSASH